MSADPAAMTATQTNSPTEQSLDGQLQNGLTQLGLNNSAPVRTTLLALLDLLQQWNRTYNLTAIRDPAAMVTGHLLDSLAVLPHLPQGSLLDLGCGAGFPGLPIAILEPNRPVTLLDSNQKKTRFVQHAIAQLQLGNCQVIHERAQRFTPPVRFDTVICRAYSSLADFVAQAKPLVTPQGTLIAMKGQLPSTEIASLPSTWQLVSADSLTVPGVDQARHLVVLKRSAAQK